MDTMHYCMEYVHWYVSMKNLKTELSGVYVFISKHNKGGTVEACV